MLSIKPFSLHDFFHLLYSGESYGVFAKKTKEFHANRTIPPLFYAISN
jgi:hypothetical protein